MRWGLRSRLIVFVTASVAAIIVVAGLVTASVLQGILQANLDARVRAAVTHLQGVPGGLLPASEMLDVGRQEPGFMLIIGFRGTATGAVVTDARDVEILTDEQIAAALESAAGVGFADASIPRLGQYRVAPVSSAGRTVGIVGLPQAETNQTLAAIVGSVAVITTVGLVVLAAGISWVIHIALRPLRVVNAVASRVSTMELSEGDVHIDERVPASFVEERTDIGQVGLALNSLLDNVDSAMRIRQQSETKMRAFVADASHELRTPLAAVRGYSELSLRDPALAEHTRMAVDRIHQQSLHMSSLVEDLLLLARMDDRSELRLEPVDLAAVVEDALTDARLIGEHHEWDQTLPTQPVVIRGDAIRMRQVVNNLLTNALRHTPPRTHISVTLRVSGGDAVIEVLDTGPGIAPTLVPHLFDRFTRGDESRNRATGGTGLGLAIAEGIVLAHHGTIAVSSVPGRTCFTVALPLSGDSTAIS